MGLLHKLLTEHTITNSYQMETRSMNRYTFKRHRFPPQVIALKRIVNPGKGFYTPPENPP